MMARLYHHTFGISKRDKKPPLWERLTVRALVAAFNGRDYRRHIHRARIAARRAEFEDNFNRAQYQRARGARV